MKSISQKSMDGEYYFRKMEMAAGFKFTRDGRFEFFYTYGAVDRSATGKFTVDGDTVKLKSDKEPGRDFTVTGQIKQGQGYNLVFKHSNKYLLKNIVCIFVANGQAQQAFSDENGELHVDLAHCDTIYVVHNLFPDVPTLVKDEKNENNNFTLELKPSLEQVSFKDMYFKIIDDKTISCINNYIIDASDVKFVKQ